jgi:hypothetical protein
LTHDNSYYTRSKLSSGTKQKQNSIIIHITINPHTYSGKRTVTTQDQPKFANESSYYIGSKLNGGRRTVTNTQDQTHLVREQLVHKIKARV